jgi:hypothetical protein
LSLIYFSSSLGQNLLDSLLFFQQESTHDTLLDTSGTARTTVSTRNSSLSLLGSVVFTGSEVLDTWQRSLAVAAFWSFGGLVNRLGLQSSTRGSYTLGLVLPSVVGMASNSRPAAIGHDEKLNLYNNKIRQGYYRLSSMKTKKLFLRDKPLRGRNR